MYRYSFLLLLLLLPALGWAQGKNFSTAAKPGWLVPYKPDAALTTNTKEVSEGYYQLLFEEQYHLEQKTIYRHIIRQIVSEAGIQNGSQINASYNPEYEKLVFHEVLIRRNGTIINRLTPGKFKIIQKEEELSLHIYSGTYNAFYLVEDVRKGDQIEYAYSIIGENPIFADKFSETLYLASYEPVTNFYKALIVSPTRKLYFKSFNDAPKPLKKTINGLDLYEWNLGNKVYILDPEDYAPSWYAGFPYYEVSEYNSWKEVIDWAAKVNDIPMTGPELQSRIAQIKKMAGDDKEKYLLEAIRFVQDDIRYMGIELGEYSHRPNTPEKVCQQRFGDCKDKSLLLCALLRANGITAWMAYVNTGLKGKVADEQPSPTRFNHVIAKIFLDDHNYWVDATFSYQRGPLKKRYNPDFGKALVLGDSSTTLTDIPLKDFGQLYVNEEITLPNFKDDSASLTVVTEYTGLYADNLRAMIANTSMKNLETDYVDFYKKIYGKVNLLDSLHIADFDKENMIRVKEKYTIRDPWQVDSANNNQLTFNSTAHVLKDKLVIINDTSRKTPLTLFFPNQLDYTITIKLPEPWALDAKNYRLESPFYDFSFKSTLDDKTVTLKYDFRAKTDHIPAEGIEQYIKDMDKLVSSTGYLFSYDPSKVGKENTSPSGINWLVLFVAVASGAFFIYVALKYYKRSVTQEHPTYEAWDLGGWLVLVGISLVISPVIIMIGLFGMETFHNSLWTGLGAAYPDKNLSLMQLFLLLEVVGNVFLLILICFTTLLFFRKRDLFPRTMIFMLAFNILLVLIDSIMAEVVFNAHMLAENLKEIIRPMIFAGIWIPYLLVSHRVKHTFVVPYEEE
ncbi:DUF3857 domain-containing protein [Chitinophaga sp. SYP-B3965]|uniref:DUF3857 domain-containing protein n=1 Tax=Chitinophaga sp. SYP-B3965 TaxID=2663120 RepID=UPI001299C400|nr:DUF3857 domain-containing protein [Chitinophaga sp. SYP-B3965]MRG46418.1 DUF3857 domain-containing protein [Chitinophaga sp. SYP-B3965]